MSPNPASFPYYTGPYVNLTNLGQQAQELCAYWQDHESEPSKSSRFGKLGAGNYVAETTIPRFHNRLYSIVGRIFNVVHG
jgi:hypothetical protein